MTPFASTRRSSGSRASGARSTAWKATSSNPEEARARLTESGDAIVAGVEEHLSRILCARAALIADAWGRLDAAERARLDAEVRMAADAATARVVGELRELLAQSPTEQRSTPLQLVRTSYREPTAALAAAGIPGVVRDPFDERSWPDDDYGLVVRTLAELDDDLGPLQLAWGLAKARLIAP